MLDDHVVFEVECIDRVYLNLYQPRLMYPMGVVGFFKGHRGMPFASSALMDPISKDFVVGIHRFIRDRGLDLVHFQRGQRKDDVAHDYLRDHDGTEGILFVGRLRRRPGCTGPRSGSTRTPGRLPVDGDGQGAVDGDGQGVAEPLLLLRVR